MPAGMWKDVDVSFAIILSIFILFPVLSVHAQDATGEKDWSFNLAPLYLGGISMNGDMTIKGTESSVDSDFSDIFENLNGAFTGLNCFKTGDAVGIKFIDHIESTFFKEPLLFCQPNQCKKKWIIGSGYTQCNFIERSGGIFSFVF